MGSGAVADRRAFRARSVGQPSSNRGPMLPLAGFATGPGGNSAGPSATADRPRNADGGDPAFPVKRAAHSAHDRRGSSLVLPTNCSLVLTALVTAYTRIARYVLAGGLGYE